MGAADPLPVQKPVRLAPLLQVEASRYLKKWSQLDGFLDRQRVGSTHVYTLRPKA